MLKLDPQELLTQTRDAMTARRVFGDPIEREGVLILPVASVMGGAAGGGGPLPAGAGEDAGDGAEGAAPAEGYGAGYGMAARPLGVYRISGEDVEWRPAIDVNRQLTLAAIISILVILSLRSVLLAFARR